MKRKSMPRAKYWFVLGRDKQTCRYCSRTGTVDNDPDGDQLEIDHYLPVWVGGSDDIGNLRLSCYSCNHQKGGAIPKDVEHLAVYPPTAPPIAGATMPPPRAASDVETAFERDPHRMAYLRALAAVASRVARERDPVAPPVSADDMEVAIIDISSAVQDALLRTKYVPNA
jgi:hypothetical protein